VEAVPAQPIDWEWHDGVLRARLDRLDIYTILSVQ